jgi:hypothetical protein
MRIHCGVLTHIFQTPSLLFSIPHSWTAFSFIKDTNLFAKLKIIRDMALIIISPVFR